MLYYSSLIKDVRKKVNVRLKANEELEIMWKKFVKYFKASL